MDAQSLQLSTHFTHLASLIPFPEETIHLVQVALASAHTSQEVSSHYSQTSVFNLYPLLQPPAEHLFSAAHVVQLASHLTQVVPDKV